MRTRIAFAMATLLAAGHAAAAPVTVTEAPRAFEVVAPEGWSQVSAKGDVRARFVSGADIPFAQCTVMASTLPLFSGQTQAELSAEMQALPDKAALARDYAEGFNDVQVLASSVTTLAGLPAQAVRIAATAPLAQGAVAFVDVIYTRTLVAPDQAWVVGCGVMAPSREVAQKTFRRWQSELTGFPASLRFK